MRANLDGKMFPIFAKIRHDYKHYKTIEIFCGLFFCDFEHLQIFAKNSVANKFQSIVV